MGSNLTAADVQQDFDAFYEVALQLLERFYPHRQITVTSRDPYYITAAIKAKLRRKNRLMRAGRIEEANALAQRIGKDIVRRNKTRLSHISPRTSVKDLWAAVRQLTGRKQSSEVVDGITAESLNQHYARISTDPYYQPPKHKLTTASRTDTAELITEFRMFEILDKLRNTATGMDLLPAWFLRLGAPVFCGPLARLFNKSIASSTVPKQWKLASITPVPKTATPQEHADFRPISITAVLSRTLERVIVREFIYPAILEPPVHLSCADQYAFRPTGSTTAAIVAILQSVTELLSCNSYVVVITLDFSKAFDTVRHSTLLDKMASMNIPDDVYNWLVNFFSGHSHCTRFCGSTSGQLDISASIMQGSAIGPASYVVNAADLTTVTAGNLMFKYADDTYIVIPAANVNSRSAELDHVDRWAQNNNLRLNRAKSAEIVFTNCKRKHAEDPPPQMPDVRRVTSIKMLGVTMTNHLSAGEHVRDVIGKCAQSLHALKLLRHHGMSDDSLRHVYKAVVLSKLLYASPAWWGFTNAADKQRLEASVRRAIRLGLYTADDPTTSRSQLLLVAEMDDNLFANILSNPHHVLHKFLPNKTDHS